MGSRILFTAGRIRLDELDPTISVTWCYLGCGDGHGKPAALAPAQELAPCRVDQEILRLVDDANTTRETQDGHAAAAPMGVRTIGFNSRYIAKRCRSTEVAAQLCQIEVQPFDHLRGGFDP